MTSSYKVIPLSPYITHISAQEVQLKNIGGFKIARREMGLMPIEARREKTQRDIASIYKK